jgi:hypothetical protein
VQPPGFPQAQPYQVAMLPSQIDLAHRRSGELVAGGAAGVTDFEIADRPFAERGADLTLPPALA